MIEVVVFVWLFGPSKAWCSIHEGADIRIPTPFKWILTFVTPVYLTVILVWWGVTDALPILRMDRSAAGGAVAEDTVPYVLLSRALMVAVLVGAVVLVRLAWRRNGYDDRAGLPEVAAWDRSAGAPPSDAAPGGLR